MKCGSGTTPRSGEEIASSWNGKIDSAAPGLLGCWSFDEDIHDQNVYDSSPLLHHGTLGDTLGVSGDDPMRVPSTAPIVPEPAAWLMAVVGAGLVAGRRSRRTSDRFFLP